MHDKQEPEHGIRAAESAISEAGQSQEKGGNVVRDDAVLRPEPIHEASPLDAGSGSASPGGS